MLVNSHQGKKLFSAWRLNPLIRCGDSVDKGENCGRHFFLHWFELIKPIYFRSSSWAASNAEGERAALAHITVATDQRTLPTDHHVYHSHDAIDERVTAAIHVVEIGLRHAIIHVDGEEGQLDFGGHLC